MKRIPEPELMDDDEQAEAYHGADFSEAHDRFVALFRERFPVGSWKSPVLDLGCGNADVTLRFAAAFPGSAIDGVDGAESMLRLGRQAVAQRGVSDRVRLYQAHLPMDRPPRDGYGAVISNSLLHHLDDPMTLWSSITGFAQKGAAVLIMDLIRPADAGEAARLVDRYAGDAPEVLRRDFYNSLCAAYRPTEVEGQLERAGLVGFAVEQVSDRHFIVAGRV
jgi:ubiquinone/menaquinone biosynthesis C-methylase UbiE